MSTQILYRTAAIATGGRAGHVRGVGGGLDAPLSLPVELGGAGGDGLNPEQLFAAGYAACFGSALQFVAGQRGVHALRDIEVRAEVGIGPRSEGGFGLAVALAVAVGGVEEALARELVAEAHAGCPYSNALRGNVDVSIDVSLV